MARPGDKTHLREPVLGLKGKPIAGFGRDAEWHFRVIDNPLLGLAQIQWEGERNSSRCPDADRPVGS